MISCENLTEYGDYTPNLGDKIYFSECPDYLWSDSKTHDENGCFGIVKDVNVTENYVFVEIPGEIIRFDFDGSRWDHSYTFKRESWDWKGNIEVTINPESEGFT